MCSAGPERRMSLPMGRGMPKESALGAEALGARHSNAEGPGPNALFDRALRVTPGGVHSPVRAFKSVGGTPIFFKSGAGARLTAVDGREYIDFCLSFGP